MRSYDRHSFFCTKKTERKERKDTLFANYVSEEKKEKVIETMTEGIHAVRNSERFKEFLDFCSMFHHYSFGNKMLIWAQRPNATFVAGARKWNKLGRHIKKGEKGIFIYAPAFKKVVRTKYSDSRDEETDTQVIEDDLVEDPDAREEKEVVEKVLTFFKIVYVWDVSQTEGKDLPLGICQPLVGNAELWPVARAFIMSKGIKVEETPFLGDNTMGMTDGKSHILIKETVSEMQKLKTLFHEYAHISFGHVGRVAAHELEAESAAYLICRYLGLDTSDYSFDYLATWLEGKDDNDLRTAISKAISFAEGVIDDFRKFAGIDEAVDADAKETEVEQQAVAEVDQAAIEKEAADVSVDACPGTVRFTRDPREVFGESYRDSITLKPSVAKFLAKGDSLILTEEGDISNARWLIYKDFVPGALKSRIERYGGSFNHPYPDGVKSTADLRSSFGTCLGKLKYEFSVHDGNDRFSVFSGKDRELKPFLLPFDEDYISYLKKAIPSFGLVLYDYGSVYIATVMSGEREVGFLMPIAYLSGLDGLLAVEETETVSEAKEDATAGEEAKEQESQAVQEPDAPDAVETPATVHAEQDHGPSRKKPLYLVDRGDSLVVKGKTYPYRVDLKGLGGKWDSREKCWVFPQDHKPQVQGFLAKIAA